MDQEIIEFTTAVGAKEPSPGSPKYNEFRTLFKRSNYFVLRGKFVIVKISRSPRPFWGVGKSFIDFLNVFDDYLLVLLTSARDGWVCNKKEINRNIESGSWMLSKTDYKINPYTLKSQDSFSSPETFLLRIET